ncbi:MAG: hypothetical protein RR301_11460, partial [Clostridia bacterium]
AEKAKVENEAIVKPEENPRRRVKIQLFKDNGKYKEPLFVQVNDYRAAIPRGMVVEVPFFVAEHIREMQEQDASAAIMMQLLTQEYAEKANVLN